MAPNIQASTTSTTTETISVKDDLKPSTYRLEIVWRNVVLMGVLHSSALYGLYLCFASTAKWSTLFFAYFLYVISGLGITAGAHRLWSHKSYKAKIQLRIILAIFNCMALQNHIYEWSRDHRVHHKYSETDGDPHNATRGFFFAHVGWLLCKKHPDVRTKGKNVDVSDLLHDPVVRFQKKYYIPLVLLFCFLLPTVIPYYLWGETLWNAYFICGLLRYCFTLNMTWLVNSAAHMWGRKPYDHHINPSENLFVAIGTIGEGFHNFHHTFPWDYATSEWGWKINISTIFIDRMAAIGWAYDLKKVSKDVIEQRRERTGDIHVKGHYGPPF